MEGYIMSSSRRPWYPWNPKEFNNDEKVKCLTPLAELIYRRLLDVMWENNDIRMPNAIDLLYDCCGKGIAKDEFAIAWTRIQYPDFELFVVSEDKKWITSRRLAREAASIAEKSKVRKTAGKKGAENRWKERSKQKDGKHIAKGWQLPTDPYPDITPIVPLKGDEQKNGNYSNLFLRFWSVYPRKVSKGSAWRAWKKIKSPSEIINQIESAIKEQSASIDWQKDNGQFIPHPATWLNGRRWEDEVTSEIEIEREYVE